MKIVNFLLLLLQSELNRRLRFQQLLLKEEITINYFPFDNGRYELDFIIENGDGDLIPFEVKSGKNLQASSFKIYCERNKPKTAIKTSLTNYKAESWMINLPLYAMNMI